MPIKVTCQCGKSFAAKDELAGKAVKCPGCQKPIKIPAATSAAASQRAAAKSAPEPKPHANDDLFDEIGLAPQEATARPCPGCGSSLPENAVVCIRCGFNTKLGRRMETVKTGGEEEEGAHGAVAAGLLKRAATVIDEDKAEEQKKTKEGLPWWIWLIIFVVILGFLAYMIIRANRMEEKPKEEKAALPSSAPITLTRRASEGDRQLFSEFL